MYNYSQYPAVYEVEFSNILLFSLGKYKIESVAGGKMQIA